MSPGAWEARDAGPLRWIRSPLPWERFDLAADGRGVRVIFVQAGTAVGAAACVAELTVAEDHRRVAITLFERELAGTFPDGAIAARPLAAVTSCLEVHLERALGERMLIDGASGTLARRIDPSAAEGSDDWFALRALERGCPIWMS